jgi:predicted transposase/invertase (TIGR01784 family)
MMLGIDPKVDYAFKWLFGNQKNTSILIHLLHAILNPAPEEQIMEIQILNPFNDKMALDEKLSILDIKARDQLGRQFNIEMQMLATAVLKQRILYYWGKLYTEQLQSGQNYGLLKPTISICFVDGVLFPAVPEYHLWFQLISPLNGIALTDHPPYQRG